MPGPPLDGILSPAGNVDHVIVEIASRVRRWRPDCRRRFDSTRSRSGKRLRLRRSPEMIEASPDRGVRQPRSRRRAMRSGATLPTIAPNNQEFGVPFALGCRCDRRDVRSARQRIAQWHPSARLPEPTWPADNRPLKGPFAIGASGSIIRNRARVIGSRCRMLAIIAAKAGAADAASRIANGASRVASIRRLERASNALASSGRRAQPYARPRSGFALRHAGGVEAGAKRHIATGAVTVEPRPYRPPARPTAGEPIRSCRHGQAARAASMKARPGWSSPGGAPSRGSAPRDSAFRRSRSSSTAGGRPDWRFVKSTASQNRRPP